MEMRLKNTRKKHKKKRRVFFADPDASFSWDHVDCEKEATVQVSESSATFGRLMFRFQILEQCTSRTELIRKKKLWMSRLSAINHDKRFILGNTDTDDEAEDSSLLEEKV